MSDIHPTAVIEDGAQIDETASIGPFCTVGPNVVIGKGTKLRSHVNIEGYTTLGEDCEIFPHASIGTETQDLKFRGAKSTVVIGNRTRLRECATVNAGTEEGEVTSIGDDCFLMAYTHVAHKCKVGNEVVMANCAQLAGHVTVEDKVGIGGLTGVHQFVKIGTMSFIGASSRINKDIPPYMLVADNPAVLKGINVVGLRRRGLDSGERLNLKKAYHLLSRKGLNTSDAVEKMESDLDVTPHVRHFIDFIKNCDRGVLK